MTASRRTSALATAVKRDLSELEKRSPGVAKSSEAALALSLAATVDGDEPLAARVSAGRLLAETMASLRAAAPPVEVAVDRLDELTARRAVRKAKAS